MNWQEYCVWTHATAVRRVEGKSDDRERAELLEIWGLGLGGEFLEMLAACEIYEEYSCVGVEEVKIPVGGGDVLEEAGDCLYYLARLYVDTDNVERSREAVALDEGDCSLPALARHVGRVVETVKKALRKEGRPGINRLATDRREEFGGLLNLALAALEGWLARHGMRLERVLEVNRKKLEARRAAGTIGAQGARNERKTT